MFEPFPKIARLFRDCVITEKLDGTNAQVIIEATHPYPVVEPLATIDDLSIWAGSRTRLITTGKSNDNYGFAGWVRDNAQELVKLGVGRHFGEWWGAGIQRGYGLPKGEKRFSLFNATRWGDDAARPACCHVVPELYCGKFSTNIIDGTIDYLKNNGSQAAPGFMKPEGVIVWHEAARQMFKVTCERDEAPKGIAA